MISIILDKTFNIINTIMKVVLFTLQLTGDIFCYINGSERASKFVYTGLLFLLGVVIIIGLLNYNPILALIFLPLLMLTGIYFVSLILKIE